MIKVEAVRHSLLPEAASACMQHLQVVGEAIAAWEAVRPAQPDLVDPKTGERVQFLFCYRAKLQALGLVLPTSPKAPPGIKLSFAWTRVRGNRIYVSGHSAQEPDGSFIGTFGKVPTEVSLEAAQASARSTALSMLASLKRELGDLDRVTAWLMVYGMVNAEPGYAQTTNAINGFSDLILELYGPEVGQHARMAVGMATLPLNNAVTIAAEVEFAP